MHYAPKISKELDPDMDPHENEGLIRIRKTPQCFYKRLLLSCIKVTLILYKGYPYPV